MLALMKSFVAISRFVQCSPARRAICASCGVRSSRVRTSRLAGFRAGRQQLGPRSLGEAAGPHRCEQVERESQLDARVGPALLAA